MPETRRKYDPEFREGAVPDRPGDRQADRSGGPGSRDRRGHVGELGEAGPGRPGRGVRPHQRSTRAYVRQLERENAELRMERDVLKRSVVLWVKEATR